MGYFSFGRAGFAVGLRFQVRSRGLCAAKLRQELPPVALSQQRHITPRLYGLSTCALTPGNGKGKSFVEAI